MCVNGDVDLITGSVTVVAPTRRIAFTDLATPEIVLRHTDVFSRLLKRCEGMPPVVCAVVHPCDRDSLLGPLEAARRGLIEPVLVGPEAKIRAVAAGGGRRPGAARASSTPSTATKPPTRRWPWRAPARCSR